MILSQLPSLPPGALETWVVSAVAIGSAVLVGMRLFGRKAPLETQFVSKEEFRSFRETVERQIGGLRDRIDSRHLGIIEAIDKLRLDLLADAERRSTTVQVRMTQLESGLARLDERTRTSQ